MNPWEASVPEWVTAGASVATLVGLVLVYVQLKTQKMQLNRDIENDYVQRYWQIRDNLDAVRPGSKGERRWRLAYLRLCEDQIDLHARGGVTSATWDQWDEGIRAELRSVPVYRRVLSQVDARELQEVRRMIAEMQSASEGVGRAGE